ncbi:hypothetical protein [Amycolatopsis sp. FDAARGOS 1241]|uniref:hypothetical protein n=1 Tax=Amycolatopsis sp. FDAARGOS 1241 TaxID=2778070 RepID=UPI00195095B7|nr:hypothetical protein [Amycolatopsis sp. FDAARGOS 1241]QRP43114.1 hypothetical protein I6J71_27215 [Amycolatopsis sp. FDAARGOS 1241]
MSWAQRLAAGPTAAHTVTKRLAQATLARGARAADAEVLEISPALFESRDLQHAVGLLLSQGVRKLMAQHEDVVFEGR